MQTTYLDINRVQNATLHKLTWSEIGELGLNNYGVFCYHGTLKTRKQGFKKEIVNEWQTNFIASNNYRVEFVKIEQTDDEPNYAMRVYDTELETYTVHINVLLGCDFFK